VIGPRAWIPRSSISSAPTALRCPTSSTGVDQVEFDVNGDNFGKHGAARCVRLSDPLTIWRRPTALSAALENWTVSALEK
jgi:hypothetical protein